MSICVDGTTSVLEVWGGGDMQEVYIGNEKVWPDVEHGIEVELPVKGGDDWFTWKQILAQIQSNEPTQANDGSWVNVVYVSLGGKRYYVNKAPKNGALLTLIGNNISMAPSQAVEIATQLKAGDLLTLNYIFNQPLSALNVKVGEPYVYNVPIKSFMRGVLVYKNAEPVSNDVVAWIDVNGLPSGDILLSEPIVTSAGATIPKDSYTSSWVQRGDVFTLKYNPDDWGVKICMRLEGDEADISKLQTNSYYRFEQTYNTLRQLKLKVTRVF